MNQRSLLLAAAMLLLSISYGVNAQTCTPTPSAAEGPFFQLQGVQVKQHICTSEFGGDAAAAEEPRIKIFGFIKDTDCSSVNGESREVKVHVWQADNNGDYNNNQDTTTSYCRGVVLVNATGFYEYTTYKPAMYPGRPPHIHYKVEATGYRTVTTQLYWSGDDLSVETCSVCGSGNPALVFTPSNSQGRFDVVLQRASDWTPLEGEDDPTDAPPGTTGVYGNLNPTTPAPQPPAQEDLTLSFEATMQVTEQQFRAEQTKYVKAVAESFGVMSDDVTVVSVTATSDARRRLLAEGVVVKTEVAIPAEDSASVRELTAEAMATTINGMLEEEGLAAFDVQIAEVELKAAEIDDASPSGAAAHAPQAGRGLAALVAVLCWRMAAQA